MRILTIIVLSIMATQWAASEAPMSSLFKNPPPAESTMEWPRAGTLQFVLQLEGINDTRSLDIEKGKYAGVKFLQGPAFDLHLFFTQHGLGGLGTLFHTADGKEKHLNTPLTHLRGGQPYLFTLTWNLDTAELRTYINGIWQGDIGHWSNEKPELILREGTQTTITESFGQPEGMHVRLGQWQLSPTVANDATIAADPLLASIPPLVDEGRVTHEGSLDLEGKKLKTLYEVDFSKPGKIVREQDFVEDGKWARRPPADAAWVLEGPPGMVVEERPDGLFMQTPDPEDRTNGHWVLWSTRSFPDDILIEYSFSPKSDMLGLNICFFAASGPDGGDIFQPGLPFRGGNFKPYIVGEIDSYHISPWATDGINLRATSNMRKNSGFHLVARGNDVIGGAGTGPHTVRILKSGGKVRMEANGVLCLAFDDDGQTYGPVLTDGHIGIRFMSHTDHATLHSLKVSQITE